MTIQSLVQNVKYAMAIAFVDRHFLIVRLFKVSIKEVSKISQTLFKGTLLVYGLFVPV